MKSDKENEEIMRYITKMYRDIKKDLEYQKSHNGNQFKMEHDQEFVDFIDRLITLLPSDYEKIIRNDFLQERNKKWWQEYFKKSTYYRRKSEAIAAFVDCVTL